MRPPVGLQELVARVPVALDERVAQEHRARRPGRWHRRPRPGPRRSGGRRASARSVATTDARRRSQRGCAQVRLSRWPASGSTHPGWMRAAVRPNSREVSTSSATTTQLGGRRGQRRSRGRARSGRRARPGSRGAAASRRPTCESRPGQQRDVDVLAGRPASGCASRRPAARAWRSWRDEVLPLADAQVVQELGLAALAELVAGQLALQLAHVTPQVQAARGSPTPRRVGEARVALRRPAPGSAGRSRGSWIDSAAAMTMTSSAQARASASSTIRPRRGSTGAARAGGPVCVSAVARLGAGLDGAELLAAARRRRGPGGGRAGRGSRRPRRRRGQRRPSAAGPRRGSCAGPRGR